MLPNWAGKCVAVPFMQHGRDANGWDCWGMVRWVLRNHALIEVPSFVLGYKSTKEMKKIGELIMENLGAWEKIEVPRMFDVVVLNIFKHPCHVGLVLDKNKMLHTEAGIGTVIEKFNSPIWKKRIEGIYRHESVA